MNRLKRARSESEEEWESDYNAIKNLVRRFIEREPTTGRKMFRVHDILDILRVHQPKYYKFSWNTYYATDKKAVLVPYEENVESIQLLKQLLVTTDDECPHATKDTKCPQEYCLCIDDYGIHIGSFDKSLDVVKDSYAKNTWFVAKIASPQEITQLASQCKCPWEMLNGMKKNRLALFKTEL